MSNAIPEFLDQSRYEGTKDFIRNVWQGNARGALMCNICAPAENPPEPPQNESEHWLDRFWQKRMYEMGQRRWGHDQAIPAIQPSTPMVGGGSQSTAFGATFEEKYNHTSPCIQTPEEIETLNLKPTLNDGLLPKKIEQIRYIVEKTAGKVPIQQENCGGPMDIVSMTMNDMNMLTGLYTHPKEIHRFMDAATELFINFFKAQREIVPEWVPVFSEDMWGPDDDSIHVGEDWLATISPKMALEFEIPYINRISEAFGSVTIHSCGAFHHQFDLLKKHIRNMRGIYFNAGECDFQAAVDVFKGTDVILMPRMGLNDAYVSKSRLDFVQRILSMKTDDVTVYLISGGGNPFAEVYLQYDFPPPEGKTQTDVSMEIIDYCRQYIKDHGLPDPWGSR